VRVFAAALRKADREDDHSLEAFVETKSETGGDEFGWYHPSCSAGCSPVSTALGEFLPFGASLVATYTVLCVAFADLPAQPLLRSPA